MTWNPKLLLESQLKSLNLSLPEEAKNKLLDFQRELLLWNQKINLTSIRDPRESLEKNIVDSLTPLPLLTHVDKLLDLGSGAGLPAIPLAIARPDLQIFSLETQGKKIHFQRHAGRVLGLKNFSPHQGRIEEFEKFPDWIGSFDIVVARALAHLGKLKEWAFPYLKEEGRLIAMKGPGEGGAELFDNDNGALVLVEDHPLQLPHSQAQRHLVVLQKKTKNHLH